MSRRRIRHASLPITLSEFAPVTRSRDGNKRISFLAAVIFLGLNGFDFVAPEDEVVERMLALASGELDEEAVAEWIRSRIQPRPGV